MYRFLVFLIASYALGLLAQEHPAAFSVELQLQSIEAMISEGDYGQAIARLEALPRDHHFRDRIEYNRALCELYQTGRTGPLTDFIRFGETPHLVQQASLDAGRYFFDRNKYTSSIHYLRQVTESFLATREKAWRNYQLGYSYFHTGQPDSAHYFLKRSVSQMPGGWPRASYYLGLLAYQQGDVQEALHSFLLAENDPELRPLVAVFTAHIYYQRGNYPELYAYAESRLELVDKKGKASLYRFMGEAYFDQKDYRKAAENLQSSLDLQSGAVEAIHYYKLAYAYDRLKNSTKAIQYYKVAALESSETGQLGAFRLGQLYLNQADYQEAIAAFRAASVLDYDKPLAHQSAFLRAKCQVQAGQYADAIQSLETFLREANQSLYAEEARDLLATSYMNTSDFDAAIRYLEGVGTGSALQREAYQKANFYKGTLLLQAGKLSEAISCLLKSQKYTPDREIFYRSSLLLGECYSLRQEGALAMTHMKTARQAGMAYPDIYVQALYGLGYGYYNSASYTDALGEFRTFLNASTSDHPFYQDARVRLADCYYIQKEYAQALDHYRKAVNGSSADYATFQMGLVYYLTNDISHATEMFEKVVRQFPNSEYADNALLQSSQMLMEKSVFDKAEKGYSRLVSGYPDSPLVPQALLGRALCRVNLSDYRQAERDFADILDRFISHAASENALLGLQDLQSRGYQVTGFDNYIEQMRRINPDSRNLEAIEFEQAKSYYFNQQYESSVSRLEKYLGKYAGSPFAYDATYYLADSYYRLENWRRAVEVYSQLLHYTQGSYKMRALDRRGKALVQMGDMVMALRNYQWMEGEASTSKDLNTAQTGVLNCYIELKSYDSALVYTDKLLSSTGITASAEVGIHLSRAKVQLAKKEKGKASEELVYVITNGTDEQAAEAHYLMALLQFEDQNHVTSIETLLHLIEVYGSFRQWTDRAYLLLVDNYMAMGEWLQARATIESILAKSENRELVREAKAREKRLEELENQLILQKPKDTVRK
ncbi:MAG: tetratricopeptide repeat protein [Cyclobacteriaceae bacterium]|nr:tetratricopeptide repeat protein [Cyclobacteriaceae bacterium]